MPEAFVAFGGLGCLVCGHHTGKFGGDACGIDHLVLGISRMDAEALDVYLCRSGVEVLVLQFAEVAAVDGVGEVAPEALDVKIACAETYLLVGIEGHAYGAVGYVGIVAQVAHGLHYLCYAGLVVGTEQGGGGRLRRWSIGTYDVFAGGVIVGDVGADAGTGAVGGRVVMGYEAYRGQVLGIGVGRKGCIEVALVVEHHVVETFADHLVAQEAGKDPLLRRAGSGLRILV